MQCYFNFKRLIQPLKLHSKLWNKFLYQNKFSHFTWTLLIVQLEYESTWHFHVLIKFPTNHATAYLWWVYVSYGFVKHCNISFYSLREKKNTIKKLCMIVWEKKKMKFRALLFLWKFEKTKIHLGKNQNIFYKIKLKKKL